MKLFKSFVKENFLSSILGTSKVWISFAFQFALRKCMHWCNSSPQYTFCGFTIARFQWRDCPDVWQQGQGPGWEAVLRRVHGRGEQGGEAVQADGQGWGWIRHETREEKIMMNDDESYGQFTWSPDSSIMRDLHNIASWSQKMVIGRVIANTVWIRSLWETMLLSQKIILGFIILMKCFLKELLWDTTNTKT